MTQAIATQEPEETPATESKELVPFDEINAVTIFTGGGMPVLVAKIKARIESVLVDPTDADDQSVMRSIDRQINKIITFIDNMRLDLVTDKKRTLADIDKTGREAKIEIQQVQHDFMEPLREIEAIEAERKAKIQARWDELQNIVEWEAELSSEAIRERIAHAKKLAEYPDWGKFSVKIISAKLDIMQTLKQKFLDQQTLEAERVEAEEQRKAEVKRLQEEREENIRKKATKKAEKKAADKVKADKAAKDKRDNIKAEEAKRKIMAPVPPKPRRWRGAPSNPPAAIKKPVISEAENRRIADEKHKEKIHTEIAAALQDKIGYTESLLAVAAIVEGKIPHIKILY